MQRERDKGERKSGEELKGLVSVSEGDAPENTELSKRAHTHKKLPKGASDPEQNKHNREIAVAPT